MRYSAVGIWCAIGGGVLAQVLCAANTLGQQTTADTISIQAKLSGVSGSSVNMHIKLFDSAIGGTQVGSMFVFDNHPISNGIVTALLGPIPATVFNGQSNGQDRYMEFAVNGQPLLPRMHMTSVPLALHTVGLTRDSLGRFGIGTSGSLLANLHIRGSGYDTWLSPDQGLLRLEGPNGAQWTKLTFGREGTTAPTAAIGVASFSYGSVMAFGTSNNYAAGVTNAAIQIDHLSRVIVGGGSAQDNSTFHVHGTARVGVLMITGGADIAEPVDTSAGDQEIQPGMVMVIDRNQDGKIIPCSMAYDPAVAGVISGANDLKPGLMLRSEGRPDADGAHPLAMTGRVWVLCDASSTPIRRGDQVTSSPVFGHGMAAIDKRKSSGAVIGKAMTELTEGKGLVLVLVNLQ